VRGSKILGIEPQFEAAIAMRTSVLTSPNARITQETPAIPIANRAKRVITSVSLTISTHLSRVQHLQKERAQGQQHTPIQIPRTIVATADTMIAGIHKPK
jgi:hypothetical protein